MNQSWRQRGSCQGLDSEIFYPVAEDDSERAKEICEGCPVREACLEHALANREQDGIWGGATAKERRRMIRQRRKTA